MIGVVPKIIYDCPLTSLDGQCLDLSTIATPCRYRLVDCDAFVTHDALRIHEYTEFPVAPYTAISYVWRGSSAETTFPQGHLVVAGAEDADPISIEVLRHACLASIQRNVHYMWLDRMCIMQTSRDDKAWQISKMFLVYKSCALCIVLPDGLRRLVTLDEETAWIHRGWTLQEVLAPKTSVVLFLWKLGSGEITVGNIPGFVEEVVQHEVAISPVADIIYACVLGKTFFHLGQKEIRVRASIFGSATPNLGALAAAMSDELSEDPDTRSSAIWQCAIMRTSSRPVDMVFSIMGLFDVTIDTKAFGKNDRLSATVALAQAILKQGKSASWLGAAFRMPPCRQLCTFSQFPETSVAGKALVHTPNTIYEASELMDGFYPNELGLREPLPKGTMDDEGYLTFSARAARATPQGNAQSTISQACLVEIRGVGDPIVATTPDGATWVVDDEADKKLLDDTGDNGQGAHITYAVILGWYQKFYPGASLAQTDNIKAMLLQQHAPGKFHVVSYASIHTGHRFRVMEWQHREFCVGGPDKLPRRSS